MSVMKHSKRLDATGHAPARKLRSREVGANPFVHQGFFDEAVGQRFEREARAISDPGSSAHLRAR